MNTSEADAKAKQLYSSAAYVRENTNGLLDILIANHLGKELPALLGWGRTWEAAFELAAVRAEWHMGLPQQAPQETATPLQLPLL